MVTDGSSLCIEAKGHQPNSFSLRAKFIPLPKTTDNKTPDITSYIFQFQASNLDTKLRDQPFLPFSVIYQ